MQHTDGQVTRPRWVSHHTGISFSALLDRRSGRRTNPHARIPDDWRGASLPVQHPPDFRAVVATTPEQIAAATVLIEARYGWRGYAVTGADERGRDGGSMLVATCGAMIAGTLTLRVDGPGGLEADDGYGAAINAVRARGRRACELTRFAMDATVEWRPTFGALMALAYRIGRVVHGVTDVFAEVNPRHVAFYRRTFGFGVASGERLCERVKAPGVLLRLEVQSLERQLARLGFDGPGRAPSFAAAA
jgi:hypothetical protein